MKQWIEINVHILFSYVSYLFIFIHFETDLKCKFSNLVCYKVRYMTYPMMIVLTRLYMFHSFMYWNWSNYLTYWPLENIHLIRTLYSSWSNYIFYWPLLCCLKIRFLQFAMLLRKVLTWRYFTIESIQSYCMKMDFCLKLPLIFLRW